MNRISIEQFRAALADPADRTAPMRAYRQIAHRSAPAGARVGAEWVTWPPAVNAARGDWVPWGAEAQAAGDWLQRTREGGQPAAAAKIPAGWVNWPDGAAATPAAAETRMAGWGDWSAPPVAAA